MSPRRDMLSPLTSPNGAENAMRQAMGSLRHGLRAPVRVPPSQVKAPVRKAAPGPTPPGSYVYGLDRDGRFYLHGSWHSKGLVAGGYQPKAIGKEVIVIDFTPSLWLSTDAAKTFEEKSLPVYGFDVWMAPWGDYFFTSNEGSPVLYRSSDKGDTWGALSIDVTNSSDVVALGFGATNEIVCLFDNGSGLDVGLSSDNGDSFATETLEAAIAPPWPVFAGFVEGGAVAIYPGNDGVDADVRIARYNGATWAAPDVLETLVGESNLNAFSCQNGQKLYVAPQSLGHHLLVSTDGGTTFGTLDDLFEHIYILRNGSWVEETNPGAIADGSSGIWVFAGGV